MKNPEQCGKFIFYLSSLLGFWTTWVTSPGLAFFSHMKNTFKCWSLLAGYMQMDFFSTNLDENYSPTWIQSNFNSFTYYDGNWASVRSSKLVQINIYLHIFPCSWYKINHDSCRIHTSQCIDWQNKSLLISCKYLHQLIAYSPYIAIIVTYHSPPTLVGFHANQR